jgi:hypothetical protein
MWREKAHGTSRIYIYFIETVSENGKRLGCCHRTSPWAPPVRCREKDKALLASFLATHNATNRTGKGIDAPIICSAPPSPNSRGSRRCPSIPCIARFPAAAQRPTSPTTCRSRRFPAVRLHPVFQHRPSSLNGQWTSLERCPGLPRMVAPSRRTTGFNSCRVGGLLVCANRRRAACRCYTSTWSLDLIGMRQRGRQRDEEDSRRRLLSSSPTTTRWPPSLGAPRPLRVAGDRCRSDLSLHLASRKSAAGSSLPRATLPRWKSMHRYAVLRPTFSSCPRGPRARQLHACPDQRRRGTGTGRRRPLLPFGGIVEVSG